MKGVLKLPRGLKTLKRKALQLDFALPRDSCAKYAITSPSHVGTSKSLFISVMSFNKTYQRHQAIPGGAYLGAFIVLGFRNPFDIPIAVYTRQGDALIDLSAASVHTLPNCQIIMHGVFSRGRLGAPYTRTQSDRGLSGKKHKIDV